MTLSDDVLPVHSHRQLGETGSICIRDTTELLTIEIDVRLANEEVGVVEKIEEFCAKFDVGAFRPLGFISLDPRLMRGMVPTDSVPFKLH